MPPLTPVTPSVGHPSLEDCQEAWLDEIMPDIALDHGLNGTRVGLALWTIVSTSSQRGPPFCVHFIECHTDLESNHAPDNVNTS